MPSGVEVLRQRGEAEEERRKKEVAERARLSGERKRAEEVLRASEQRDKLKQEAKEEQERAAKLIEDSSARKKARDEFETGRKFAEPPLNKGFGGFFEKK